MDTTFGQTPGSVPNETSNLWNNAVYGGGSQYSTYPQQSRYNPSEAGALPPVVAASPETKENLLRLANQEVRMGFVRKVYGILVFMLLITLAVAMPFYINGVKWDQSHVGFIFLALVVLIATMCCMTCNPDAVRSFPTSYVLIIVFAVAMGIFIGFTVVLFTWQTFLLAAVLCFVIVVALSIFAMSTTTDFTGAAPYLLVAILMLLLFGNTLVLLNIFGVETNTFYLIYSFVGATLFSFFIVFDTQRMLGGSHKFEFQIDDYAMAALQLYLDIINLFTSLLGIMGDRKI